MPSRTSDVIKSQFIRAGAGAGKTTRLVSSFIEFVTDFEKNNERMPRVVVTTFTRKATQEVKERLLVQALEENRKSLFEYINKKSFVHISTIHGLLSLFLNENLECLKFSREIKIISSQKQTKLIKKFINEVFKKNNRFVDLLEFIRFSQLVEVSEQALDLKLQNESFKFVDKETLKKFSQNKRNLIIDSINQITQKAGVLSKPWTSYFEYLHAVKNCVESNRYEDLLSLLDSAPKKPMYKEASPSLDPVAHEMLLELTGKKGHLTTLFDSDEFIEKHQLIHELFDSYLNELFKKYYEHKKNTGELTISDLENLSLKVITVDPKRAEEFSETWDYFMIDEYQDTSPLQVKILNHIVGQKPCFIVGDPQQSIYLFRGARSEVFENKHKQMQSADAKIDFLEMNYRSEPSLMSFINDFFEKFSKQFMPMKTKTDSIADKKLNYDAFYVSGEDQNITTLKHIKYMLDAGVKPQDICVLSRNHKNLEAIAYLATQYGINVQLQSSAGFEQKREIMDLIAFNKFLNNPHDDENFINLVRSPWLFVSDEQLVQINSQREKNQSYYTASRHLPISVREKLNRYLSLYEVTGISQTTQQFVAESGILSLSSFYDRTGKREANIFKYLTALAEAESVSGFLLGQFLEEQFESVSLDSGSANSEAQPVVQPDCVSLMTVHASKGLQFRHVILVGLADRINLSSTPKMSYDENAFTYSLKIFNEETGENESSLWTKELLTELNNRELAESERVLYVALTRAKESISLINPLSKKAASNTWLGQINWPAEGDHSTDKYKVLSVRYENELQSDSANVESAVQIKDKLQNSLQQEAVINSVTELLSAKSVYRDSKGHEQKIKHLKKAQFGTDLHRVFESLKYLEAATVLKQLNETEKSAVDYLFGIKDFNLMELLQKGHNEWGFGIKAKQKMLQGQIDLWAELDKAVYIVDYKTGSSEYSDTAFEQLSFYNKALYTMNLISKNKPVVHAVIYPVEKTLKILTFADAEDFESKLSSGVKEIFN